MTRLPRPIELSEARDGDAAAMAAVLVAAWQDGYRGILDDALIDGTGVGEWETILEHPVSADGRTVVATDGGGEIVGFVRFGPDPDPPHGGYIASLYVHPEAAGHGLGRRLVELAAGSLAADGHRILSLWVFRENTRARALYEGCGFVVDAGEMTDPRWGAPQVRYRLSPISVRPSRRSDDCRASFT